MYPQDVRYLVLSSLFIDRARILFGKPTSIEEDLQKRHALLIRTGFYRNFRQVMDALYQPIRVEVNKGKHLKIITGLSVCDIQLAAKQKLFLRTLQSNSFKKSIVFANVTNTSICFPLDENCQIAFASLGLKFNKIACKFLLLLHNILFTVNAFRKLIRTQWFGIRNYTALKEQEQLTKNYGTRVFLFGLSAGNFPTSKFQTYDFVSWVKTRLGENKAYFHDSRAIGFTNIPNSNIDTLYRESIAPALSLRSEIQTIFAFARFVFSAIFIKKSGLFNVITQVDEIQLLLRLNLGDLKTSFRTIVFPNTVIVAKPLWATFLEYFGAEVVFVNYSASAEPLDIGSDRIVDGIWNLSSWTKAWVVDEVQRDQMRLKSPYINCDFEVTGVPFWSGRRIDTNLLKGRKWVSVFDTAIRTNLIFSASSIDDLGWNDSKLEKDFIRLILEAVTPLNYGVIHKKKRKVSESSEIYLKEEIEDLKLEFGGLYLVVDEDIAPESLIENSSFVISKPISTTAFIALGMGIPSIVFDPTGNLQKSDPGLRTLMLAHNHSEIMKIITNFNTQIN